MRAAKTAGALTGDQNYDGALRANVQKGWSAVEKRVGALSGDAENGLSAVSSYVKKT